MSENGRCCADRADEDLSIIAEIDGGLDDFGFLQIQRARHAAREHDHLKLSAQNDLTCGQVTLDLDSVRTGDRFAGHADNLHFLLCTAEKIDGSQCLHFLKAVC